MPNVVLVVLNLLSANLSYSTPALDHAFIEQTLSQISSTQADLHRTHFSKKKASSNRPNQAQLTTRFENELKAAIERQNMVLDLQIQNHYTISESA